MSKCASSLSDEGDGENAAAPGIDWKLVIDLYSAPLRQVIQRRVKASMVDDVLQETFLRAFRNQHAYDPEREILPWLVAIAKRAAADARRGTARSLEFAVVEQPVDEAGFDRVEEDLVRRFKRRGIDHALAGLNQTQRRVLTSVANGVPYEEIAAAENMTTNAARCVTLRARTNFRQTYFGFGRGLELFGGAVGAALLKLRLRLQRYQEFVNGHATAFGVATFTVVAVGVATYPSARPAATEATEMTDIATFAASQDPSALVLLSSALADPVAPLAIEAARTAPADIGSADTANADPINVDATASVGREGDEHAIRIESDSTTPFNDTQEREAYLEVDCTEGTMARMWCDVMKHVEPVG